MTPRYCPHCGTETPGHTHDCPTSRVLPEDHEFELHDPSIEVVTLLVTEEYEAADRVIAGWCDSGHADLLIDGLCELIMDAIEETAEATAQSPAEFWQERLLVRATLAAGE